MIDRIVTFALQQRVFMLAAGLVLVIGGLFAWRNLPIEAFPDVQDTQVLIITPYVGQAPEEVERSISLPIELEMGAVPRMTQLRSVSITGLSVVTLTFADGTNDYFARQQVLERLLNADLPPGVQAQIAPLTNAVGEVYRYVIDAPKEMPLHEVRALQDWVLRPALRRVPGIAEVVSFGGGVKEYQVRLNPYLLRKHNITVNQMYDALQQNSANTGGGLLNRGDEALVVRSIGLFRNLDDIGRVIVSARDGKTITIADLATVEIGDRQRQGVVAFNDRDDIVQGIVQMVKGQNAAPIIEAVKARLEELKPRLPPGVTIVPYYDRTELVQKTVHTVTHNLAVGAILVVGILWVFLRSWQAALIVALVIPLSLLFAFIVMDWRGVAANLISLGAVDFGIIVDSAVVVVEALMVKLAAGARDGNPLHVTYGWRMHALKSTVMELGRPILFSKAIIILAFLPIFTFQRVEGKIFSPMAYTLSFALLGAIVLTLTLVPALLSFALQKTDMSEKHSEWMHRLQLGYRAALVWAKLRRTAIMIGSTVALAVSLAAAPFLGSEFLPKLDEGNIWLTIVLPPATALARTKEIERDVREIIRSFPEVRNVVTQVGRPDDGTDPKGPNNLEVLADLKPREEWRFATKDALIAEMTRKIRTLPGVPTNFSQVIQDNLEEALSGAKGEIVVKIFGPDLDVLEERGDRVAEVLTGIRGSADVGAIRIGGQSEVAVTIDRLRMARYGIDIDDVNKTVQIAMAGRATNVFFDGDRRFDVTLRIDRAFRDAVDDVAELLIPVPSGTTIPLGAIAEVEVKQGAARVTREGGGRYVTVKTNLRGRDMGSFVAEAIQAVNAQVKLPPGYSMTWGGQFENQQRALARLQVIIPLSGLMIFTLLFWMFRSLAKAALIILMVPFTLIGGFIGLGIAQLTLSISAAVGFIAVAGISVQNGVIMVERFIENMEQGMPLERAVLDGATSRLRAILMTALMAGLGLLPAALSHGIGSEVQRPFAVVIVGGMVTGTLFTLLLLPLLYPTFVRAERSAAEQELANDEASPADR